jgi:hypothetical protein
MRQASPLRRSELWGASLVLARFDAVVPAIGTVSTARPSSLQALASTLQEHCCVYTIKGRSAASRMMNTSAFTFNYI